MVEMKLGDFINIPAHKKHRVEWTTPDEPTIWLAVRFSSSPSINEPERGPTLPVNLKSMPKRNNDPLNG